MHLLGPVHLLQVVCHFGSHDGNDGPMMACCALACAVLAWHICHFISQHTIVAASLPFISIYCLPKQ